MSTTREPLGPFKEWRHRALYRVGRRFWLVADDEIRGPDVGELISHCVYFSLLYGSGNKLAIGFSIITEIEPDNLFDSDGERFPDLDTAVDAHAARYLKLWPVESANGRPNQTIISCPPARRRCQRSPAP
jgi:hypothetical protein